MVVKRELMNTAIEIEEGKSIGEYISAIKRRKYHLIIPALVIFLLSAFAAYVWPPTYQSTATILIEEQEIPKDLVRSTITSFASQQIQVIRQRTMTIQNIMQLVEKYQLFDESELRRRPKTELAKEFQDNVKLDVISADVVDPQSGRPREATIAFSLSFSHGEPVKAQKVTNELVTLYLNENLRSRTEKSENTSDFLREEAKSLSIKLSKLQSNLAKFKAENEGSLPELHQYNINMVDRLEQEKSNNELRVNDLKKRLIELKSRITQIPKFAPSVLATGETILNDRERLRSLESEYRRTASVYNGSHPDVVRLKREIDLLKLSVGDISDKEKRKLIRVERDKLSAMQTKYRSNHPELLAQKRKVEQLNEEYSARKSDIGKKDDTPDNPSYLILDTQIKTAESEVDILLTKNNQLDQKISEYEKLLSVAPIVERDYILLIRNLEATQLKENEIKAKLMEAELSTNLEQGRKGERFLLIQPPVLPEKPISPNRIAIIIIGLVFGIGVGLAIVLLLDTLDPSVRGDRDVFMVTGVAPLVSIPLMKSEESLRSIRRAKIAFVILLIIGVILAIAAVHFFIKPLDVIWFYLLRSFGYGV